MLENSSKPCLVQTSQGFCVKYKEKFLYSKYNPKKNICTLIENLNVLPGTVFLCVSPILSYGINELYKKLNDDCLIILIEKDKALFDFLKNENKNIIENKKNIITINPEELYSLPEILKPKIQTGNFRRVIRIDFSAGSTFFDSFYNSIFEALRDSVAQFWKNRITLVKFGKRYSCNLFKNLKFFANSIPFPLVSKPILVVGAGESAEETIKSICSAKIRNNFFILAVDVCLPFLNSMKIIPDAIICEESQAIIAKSFVGKKQDIKHFFFSSVVPQSVSSLEVKKTSFYTPLFAESDFLKKMQEKNIIPNIINPLGSVGLSATEIALSIRKNEEIPVIVTGLDFSFSVGESHVKGSLHEKNRRINHTKVKSFSEFSSSFSSDSIFCKGKNEKNVITTTPLSSYKNLFSYKFSNTKNLFDSGKTGLFLGIPFVNNLNIFSSLYNSKNEPTKKQEILKENIEQFLKEEKLALEELKNILTGNSNLLEEERNNKIKELLFCREYLFLHFPDGYKPSLELSFLKRCRIEIDYFLRLFEKIFV